MRRHPSYWGDSGNQTYVANRFKRHTNLGRISRKDSAEFVKQIEQNENSND